jgi:hypothetical protein
MKLQIASRPLGSPFGLGAVPVGHLRNHYTNLFQPFRQIADGGDTGGGGDEGPGYAEEEFVPDDAQPDATTGEKPKFKAVGFKSAEQYVRIPGVAKPVKLSELSAALSTRGQYEAGLKTMGTLAERLKGEKKPQQQQQVKPNAETKDVLDQMEAMDLLDGKTAAGVLRSFRDGTVTPMMQAMVKMAKQMQVLTNHMQGGQQRDVEANFDGEIDRAISSLKLPNPGGKGIEGSDIVKELTRDLVLSYDPQDLPRLKGEVLQGLVKDRITKILAFAKNYQKAELDSARERQRQMRFVRPGASGSVGGKGKPRMVSNSEAASLLFAGQEGANT